MLGEHLLPGELGYGHVKIFKLFLKSSFFSAILEMWQKKNPFYFMSWEHRDAFEI